MRDGRVLQVTLGALLDHIPPETDPIEERIAHPTIRIDHDLALAWAPYTVLIDGRVDHCGTNLFSLVRDGDTWMIASIADNSRKAC